MKNVELKLPELFKDLSGIEVEGTYFDLHNDYDCYLIAYDKDQFVISFKTSMENVQSITNIDIVFKDVIMRKINFEPGDTSDMMTIDTFYRGRFEENGLLKEMAINKYYYYIEFYRGYSFELLASKIILSY